MIALPQIPGATLRENEPMARHTTLNVGGTVALFARLDTVAALQAFVQNEALREMPRVVIGAGSNALFGDGLWHGSVLKLAGEFLQCDWQEAADQQVLVTAGAAVKLGKLLRQAHDGGIVGLEMLAGIPGTIGGAVVMNAGSKLGELKDAFVACEIVCDDGRLVRRELDEMAFGYRHSAIGEHEVVVRATLRGRRGDVASSRERVEAFLDFRKSTQPLELPNCGSIFTNPVGDAAGRLIEASGLKGTRIGGAEISTVHANWIVNRGGATAADVRGLIRLAQQTVEDKFGIRLITEIRQLGEWGD